MPKRDFSVLFIAAVCGVLAFVLSINFLQNQSRKAPSARAVKAHGGDIPIPAGMRALTLSAKEIENLPSSAMTGSFVDILGMAPNYSGKMELQTIVRGAEVISMDKEEAASRKLTLAVTPVGAEVVTKALAQGKISLVLRPDGADRGVLQVNSVGFVEVIRGVQKEKNVHLEK